MSITTPNANPTRWKLNGVGTAGIMCARAIAPLAPSGNPAAAAYAKVIRRNDQVTQTPGAAGAILGKVAWGTTVWEWSDCTDPANPANPLNVNNALMIAPPPIMANEHALVVWFCSTVNPALEAFQIEIRWFNFQMPCPGMTDCC